MTVQPTSRHLRLAMVAVGALAFGAALLAIDARATYGARTTADEPQYLLSALSLAEDFDLDISDELAGRAYLPFHEVTVDEQTIELDASGQRLSPHDPLLPALLAVPMRIGGWALAKATLALIGGMAAAATLRVAVRRVGVRLGVAAAVVAGFFLSPPLVAYGSQVYPELPAALVVVVGVGAVSGSLVRRDLVLLLACVVALPWLAVKYAPVAAALAALALWSLWSKGRRREAWLAAGVLVFAGIVYLAVHQRVYGGWTVYAAGDHFVDGEFQVVGNNPSYWGRSRRLVGLLVDRRFGLVAWGPAYVALLPAVAVLIRRRPPASVAIVAILGIGWAMAAWVALTMHGWWWPGRQLVSVLPLAVVAIAGLADRFRAWFAYVMVTSGLAFLGWCWLAFEASTDRLTLIVDFFETDSPVYRLWAPLLPDHMAPGIGDVFLTLGWVAILGVLTVATVRRVATGRDPAVPKVSVLAEGGG